MASNAHIGRGQEALMGIDALFQHFVGECDAVYGMGISVEPTPTHWRILHCNDLLFEVEKDHGKILRSGKFVGYVGNYSYDLIFGRVAA